MEHHASHMCFFTSSYGSGEHAQQSNWYRRPFILFRLLFLIVFQKRRRPKSLKCSKGGKRRAGPSPAIRPEPHPVGTCLVLLLSGPYRRNPPRRVGAIKINDACKLFLSFFANFHKIPQISEDFAKRETFS